MERKRMTPLQRTKLAYNQKYLCAKCKVLLDPHFQIDHMVPLSRGGSNNTMNLQALCQDCHISKTRTEACLIGTNNVFCFACDIVYSRFFLHTCEYNA